MGVGKRTRLWRDLLEQSEEGLSYLRTISLSKKSIQEKLEILKGEILADSHEREIDY